MGKAEKTEAGKGIRGWVKRNMPTRESLSQNRMLKPFAHRFLRSDLWRFTRRSVPAGVAIGIITGLIVLVPGFQIFVAVLLCPFFRANIPTAAIATFINTPLTTPPLVYLAYILGRKVLGDDEQVDSDIGAKFAEMSIGDWTHWLFYEAGPPVLLGLFMITVLCATIGYYGSSWFWNYWVVRKRRRRSKKNAARR